MKKLRILLVVAVTLVATSCSSTNHSGTANSDDVYYSTKDGNQNQPQQTPSAQSSTPADYSTNTGSYQQDNTGTQQQDNPSGNDQPVTQQNSDYYDGGKTTDSNGNTYVTNNYFNDDYYDYAYTSRLRRFYTPVYGYSYYDPFYTNLYWYDYNPYSWGVSIYLGYHWWAPSYYYSSPFCYGGFSDPWYSPYCGSYGLGYWNSYNQGYFDGYYQGGYGYYNPYYYNSYDATSNYYGPRGSTSTNARTDRGTRNSTYADNSNSRTLGEKYVEAVNTGRINTIPKTPVGTNQNIKNETSRPVDTKNNNDSRNPSNPNSGKSTQSPTGRNESMPVNGNIPAKGIITNKNETGRPQHNQQQNTTPVYQNPANGNTGRTNQNSSQPNILHTQPGKNDVKNETGRPQGQNENHIKSNSETPRNNQNNNSINRQPRQEQNTSRPIETPRNDARPQNNNQQPAPQKNEPNRPRKMSSSESQQFHAPQMNHLPGGNYSSVRSGSGNASSSRSSGNNSSGGTRSSSGGNNNGGRGKK